MAITWRRISSGAAMVVGAAIALTWSCGSQPSSGPTPTTAATSPATPAPASTQPASISTADLDALARRAFPGDHPAGCGPLADCPVTDRLRARLVQLSQPSANGPGPVTEFCRCQNGASSMTVTSEVGAAGGVAHVTLVYGAGSTIKIDLLIVQGPDSRLLVDDTQCTGRGPVTSIYAPELVGCA